MHRKRMNPRFGLRVEDDFELEGQPCTNIFRKKHTASSVKDAIEESTEMED